MNEMKLDVKRLIYKKYQFLVSFKKTAVVYH